MKQTPTDNIAEILIEEAQRINCPEFIKSDPVQFPHRFSDVRDIEIVSLLCSNIAWGRREMICRDCNRLLELLENEPYRFVTTGPVEDIEDTLNIHRTFFGRNLKHYLRALRLIYSRHESIDAFCRSAGAQNSDAPAWTLADALRNAMTDANNSPADSRCMPARLDNSALKRLNMALRWLVRNDGIVDLGVWRSLKPAQLFIPLDVHVGNTARQLGLLFRKAQDKKSVMELTTRLREICPEDPVLLDFALFGLGIEANRQSDIRDLQ